jgi:hypothetical protein
MHRLVSIALTLLCVSPTSAQIILKGAQASGAAQFIQELQSQQPGGTAASLALQTENTTCACSAPNAPPRHIATYTKPFKLLKNYAGATHAPSAHDGGCGSELMPNYLNFYGICTTCDRPAYSCARTDFAPAPQPSPPPNIGNLTGAGTCFNDPDFGSKVCRVTDSTFDPSTKNSIVTASSSGDANLWNTDSTLTVIGSVNGFSYPVTFNPATMAVGRI